ncbi:hypothetical protein D3C78_1788490 [compost metagenome]
MLLCQLHPTPYQIEFIAGRCSQLIGVQHPFTVKKHAGEAVSLDQQSLRELIGAAGLLSAVSRTGDQKAVIQHPRSVPNRSPLLNWRMYRYTVCFEIFRRSAT